MLDRLEKEIAKELDGAVVGYGQAGGMGDERWTTRIKERLCGMGHQKGFRVRADWCNGADAGKWLVDLAWLDQKDDSERFIGMPLAMELEWSTGLEAIIQDFNQLLVVKARQKVMVFQQATPENVRNMMTVLEGRLRYFQPRLPDERYLLAGFAFKQGVYVYESA